MFSISLPIHDGLIVNSRLPLLVRDRGRLHPVELSVLLLMGLCAALATALIHVNLRIPGHAIIRSVFPMAFGLAVAPRRMAGSVMGAGAFVSAMAMHWGGIAGTGVGAMASLCLTGPLLDMALWSAKRGWRLYLGFALAGLGSNLVALGVRGSAKLLGLDHVGGRPFSLWWPQATGTYAICGVMAGLISAFVWFQFTLSSQATADKGRPT